ncbi:MAG: hypothetical protein CME68_02125 [Halobacteriovoraceae bacterium]|nr:hypothetical protein [Halobacteriovoraceae bacterium]
MKNSNYLDKEQLLLKKKSIKRIFFYRICGTGMGAAAILLKEAGYTVEGGDTQFKPPMSDYLKSTQIPLIDLKEVEMEYLRSFDLIVVGNVVSKASPDAQLIEGLGVSFCSFPASLGAFILKDRKVIGVSGTHGKTTTTYFMSQVFKNLGFRPGYFIGGVLNDGPCAYLGDSDYFFIESDEYDSAYFEKYSKFLNYEIDDLVLTSLEFDHADIYSNLEEIKDQFRRLLYQINDGTIIANSDYESILSLFGEYSKKDNWLFYSEEKEPRVKIIENKNIEESKRTIFKLEIGKKDYQFETNLIGIQNILNLSSVILFAVREGISIEKIKGAILNLKMVKKRQEEKGFFQGARVIDDFAHHPRAIRMTIDSIKKKYKNDDVVVALEPCSATSRSSLFQMEYVKVLSNVNTVILVEPQSRTTAKNYDQLDCDKLVKDLRNEDKRIYLVKEISELKASLKKEAMLGKVILFLSNGQFLGLWESDFSESLHQ